VRELTEYEKSKWFDSIGRFDAPEFVGYGDESGEYYDSFVEAEHAAEYAHNDELQEFLQIEILDRYYENLAWLYSDEGYEPPEHYGLPEWDLVRERYLELGGTTDSGLADNEQLMKETFDWAMEWRELHKGETYDILRAKDLRRELEQVEKRIAERNK